MRLVDYLINTVVALGFSFIISVPVVLIWWWLKTRKIKKRVPEEIKSQIEIEKSKMEEVQNAQKERYKTRKEGREDRFRGRKQVIKKPVSDREDEEQYVPERVSIPSTDTVRQLEPKFELNKSTIRNNKPDIKKPLELHKPTAL